ncbi:hypothetical protein IWZ00DRAFT_350342 [Phyllosticta capitalensis]|uniref:uncharacterized protein n=1 Tax=Phyllosticta capitalensis TaxID=121624 RepID=UPI0031311125
MIVWEKEAGCRYSGKHREKEEDHGRCTTSTFLPSLCLAVWSLKNIHRSHLVMHHNSRYVAIKVSREKSFSWASGLQNTYCLPCHLSPCLPVHRLSFNAGPGCVFACQLSTVDMLRCTYAAKLPFHSRQPARPIRQSTIAFEVRPSGLPCSCLPTLLSFRYVGSEVGRCCCGSVGCFFSGVFVFLSFFQVVLFLCLCFLLFVCATCGWSFPSP